MKDKLLRDPVGSCWIIFCVLILIHGFEAIVLRMDETFFAENFINKLFGILVILLVLRALRWPWGPSCCPSWRCSYPGTAGGKEMLNSPGPPGDRGISFPKRLTTYLKNGKILPTIKLQTDAVFLRPMTCPDKFGPGSYLPPAGGEVRAKKTQHLDPLFMTGPRP